MEVAEQKKVDELYGQTGYRLFLEEWETIANTIVSDDLVMIAVNTYEVQVLVREDRYKRKGTRVLILKNSGTRWYLDDEKHVWDDTFEPFVFEKIGRRKTAEEFEAQREWEKMCYRPGNAATPLDSYERVLDPFIRSTDRMERHY